MEGESGGKLVNSRCSIDAHLLSWQKEAEDSRDHRSVETRGDRGEDRKHRQLLGIPQALNKCVFLASEE